eukprot:3081021-Amphidinium_carterae.1
MVLGISRAPILAIAHSAGCAAQSRFIEGEPAHAFKADWTHPTLVCIWPCDGLQPVVHLLNQLRKTSKPFRSTSLQKTRTRSKPSKPSRS